MTDVLTDNDAWSPQSAELTDTQAWTPPAQAIHQADFSARNVIKAFGSAFAQDTAGYQDLGLSQETQDMVRKSEGYQKGSLVDQAIYDQLVVPGAAALDAAMRTGVGLFSGTGEAMKQVASGIEGE